MFALDPAAAPDQLALGAVSSRQARGDRSTGKYHELVGKVITLDKLITGDRVAPWRSGEPAGT
jgi:hypothetical protein